MIRAAFPDVEIMHSQNANLIRILQRSPVNINTVYAGSDRVKSYGDQLRNSIGTHVRELQRKETDISASKVLENIDDEGHFRKHTPKAIHGLYGEIKGKINAESNTVR